LVKSGSMMGSGGIIVMDDTTCMVEVARYYTNFLAGESCGKCTPCREGIRALVEILTRICKGEGELSDLQLLRDISEVMQEASLCALGRTAPNPVLTTLHYFRDEYIDHIVHRICPAHICQAMKEYRIDPEKCKSCGKCARVCPVKCISGRPRIPYVIDQERCIKCGSCFEACPFDAITVEWRRKNNE